MRTRDAFERIKRLRDEVASFGRNPDNYKYDLNTQNAYRIEHTKLGSYAYILINDGKHGKEARVDLSDFYIKRLYSYRWVRSSSDPKKDYPHTNTYDCNGKLVNLFLHVLIMDKPLDPKKVIDHHDGDHYNASQSNLRVVTTAQNNQNRHPSNKVSKVSRKSVLAEYVPLFA